MENVGNGQTIVPPQQMTPAIIDDRVNSTKQNGNRNGGPWREKLRVSWAKKRNDSNGTICLN